MFIHSRAQSDNEQSNMMASSLGPAKVEFLKKCGVCQICQLRYLKARGTEYENVKATFASLKLDYEESYSKQSEGDPDEEEPQKKQRLDICPCCLGLFSKTFQNRLVESILATEIEKFESSSLVIAISMPMILQIRQLSMWYALLREFGNSIDSERSPDVPIKEAAKLILNPIICEKLGKTYDINDGLMINIQLTHPDEEIELAHLKRLHENEFAKAKGKKQPVSRGLIEKQYIPKCLSAKKFEEYLSIPPSLTSSCLSLESIKLTGPAVFAAGRYRKISRKLSHTPWVLNGKRVMEDSIEEIIMKTIVPFFECDVTKVIFMSSGREDVDVRCLGKGRPFVLEIPDSRRTTLPRSAAKSMESEIDKSLKVSVRDLQIVKREELVHIKTGEEHKRKFYRALCKLEGKVTKEILEKLNLPTGFETLQKTPIRVLHRRPLHTRPRQIYSLKASVERENPDALVLDIVSQAGTYIKELVHGDFGRTIPSIRSIVGRPIDILALDVVAIDLDWPNPIDDIL